MIERKLKILLVQAASMLRIAVVDLLKKESDLTLLGIAQTAAVAAVLAVTEKPDVILIDFRLSDMPRTAAASLIRGSAPEAAIVFYNADNSETELLDAIDVGAAAYLINSATQEEFLDAVRRAGHGDVLIPVALFAKAVSRRRTVVTNEHERQRILAEFTPRELEVLRLLAQGRSIDDLADHLGISQHTAQGHVSHVIEKLGVHSKLQAVLVAAEKGLIDL